jgi:hypothetical protein
VEWNEREKKSLLFFFICKEIFEIENDQAHSAQQ